MDAQMLLQAEVESFFRLQRIESADYVLVDGTLINAASDNSSILGE